MLNLIAATTLTLTIPAGVPQDVQGVAEANNQFALDLYQKLLIKDQLALELYHKVRINEDHNLFISPYSINKTLTMVWAGARGDTEKEMASVLHVRFGQDRQHQAFLEARKLLNQGNGLFGLANPLGNDRSVQLYLSAGLWGQRGHAYQTKYLKLIHDYYGGDLQEVDFAAPEQTRQKINAWVEKQTHNKIKALFAPDAFTAATRLVLASSIYFKGDWVHPFKKNDTREDSFWVTASTKAPVKLMNQTETFGYFQDKEVQGLQMPYQGKDLAMVVLLPNKKDGLADLEKGLTAERLAGWMGQLREQKVDVWLPKFKMRYGLDLIPSLMALGMKKAFTSAADFSGINGGEDPLVISQVVHQAFVDVNEEGTEAAAATGVDITLGAASSARPPLPVFRADHPFVFAIRDLRTGVILFLGRMFKP